MRHTLAAVIVALAATPALAETCKYVDKDGRTIYSNVPIKNARKVTCFEPPAPPAANEPREGQPPPGTTQRSSPTQVQPLTQRQRDDERRRILEEELVQEQQALDEAKKALAEQEAVRSGDERNYARVLERLKPYQDAVATHEKNIISIKVEIANLK
jgi:Domain of unknown function (DUF4124)